MELLEAAEDALGQEHEGRVVDLVDEVERMLAELPDAPAGPVNSPPSSARTTPTGPN
ncbi:hypothetical protein ACKI1J_23280 [Streptomyces scabiei]|uniref:hypothetical protein n=1 Tax=Streptomyces scabiei TaxID=1930 RepID=UPI0038F71790